jgi:hypothetical protein
MHPSKLRSLPQNHALDKSITQCNTKFTSTNLYTFSKGLCSTPRKMVAPSRESHGRPWPSSRTTTVAARTPTATVNTGGKGATPVLVPRRKQPEPKKSQIHQVLCQKNESHQ